METHLIISKLRDNRVTGVNLIIAAIDAADLIEAQAAQIALLRDAIDKAMRYDWADQDGAVPNEVAMQCIKALATQPDDSALKTWLGEPFCYLRQTSSEQNPPHGWAVHFSDGEVPLYAPKGLK